MDYPKVVKNPMDLGTVKARARNELAVSVSEVSQQLIGHAV